MGSMFPISVTSSKPHRMKMSAGYATAGKKYISECPVPLDLQATASCTSTSRTLEPSSCSPKARTSTPSECALSAT